MLLRSGPHLHRRGHLQVRDVLAPRPDVLPQVLLLPAAVALLRRGDAPRRQGEGGLLSDIRLLHGGSLLSATSGLPDDLPQDAHDVPQQRRHLLLHPPRRLRDSLRRGRSRRVHAVLHGSSSLPEGRVLHQGRRRVHRQRAACWRPRDHPRRAALQRPRRETCIQEAARAGGVARRDGGRGVKRPTHEEGGPARTRAPRTKTRVETRVRKFQEV
mmetsp:Transcript_3675/g.11402  ORF Transcript_3675/g.11402 Transcript_3675/m.11402 type:complete len:214 (-) Transcript_3675:19-660(-)